LDAGTLRLVGYLQATDKIIAVEDVGHGREKTPYEFFWMATYRIAFPGLRELPSIGSAENQEGIIAAAPDLIISSAVDVGKLDQLQLTLGIPVFAVNVDVELYDTDLFFPQLVKLGNILGRESRAEELVDGIQAALADIERRASGVQEPKRAYAGGMMFYGPADLLRTTGDYLPFDLAGVENVMPSNPTGNKQPYMTSLENLIAAAPDYVFIDAANQKLSKSGFLDNRKVLEELVGAFKNQEAYNTFVYKYYGTNWENQLINVYLVGKTLYPDLYADISVKEKAEEIWEMFLGVPLDYDTVCILQNSVPGRVDWFE
jgi:iron complex transport system substrate-binding protein